MKQISSDFNFNARKQHARMLVAEQLELPIASPLFVSLISDDTVRKGTFGTLVRDLQWTDPSFGWALLFPVGHPLSNHPGFRTPELARHIRIVTNPPLLSQWILAADCLIQVQHGRWNVLAENLANHCCTPTQSTCSGSADEALDNRQLMQTIHSLTTWLQQRKRAQMQDYSSHVAASTLRRPTLEWPQMCSDVDLAWQCQAAQLGASNRNPIAA